MSFHRHKRAWLMIGDTEKTSKPVAAGPIRHMARFARVRQGILSFLGLSANGKDQQTIAGIVFVAGLMTFLVIKLAFTLEVVTNRSVPPEADDAYGYIVKAAQMKDCFFQDVPAYNDLRRQVSVSPSSPEIAHIQARQYHRLLEVYHPLHSLCMLALNGVGLSWESAYDVLTIAGNAFIVAAVGFWLYVLWGPGAAGIALLLLGFEVFPRQGLEYIVPSNLSLGIAMGTWGVVTRWRAVWWSEVAMIAGILAMIAMHAIGLAYAGVTVALYVALSPRPWPRRALLVSVIAVCVIVMAFMLPYVLSQPAMKTVRFPGPDGWNYWQGLRENLDVTKAILMRWSDSYKSGYAGMFLLLGLGFVNTPSARRRPVFANGFLLAGLLAVSTTHAIPGYPGVTFARNWVAAAVFLTGALGSLGYSWIMGIQPMIRRLSATVGETANWSKNGMYLALHIAVFVAIGVVFWRAAKAHEITSYERYKNKREYMISRHNNIELDPAQPAELLRRADPKESVLYTHEVPIYFFLTHGAHRFGAVYSPLVEGTPQEESWIQNNDSIRYVVSYNPLVYVKNPLARQGQGAIVLSTGEKLEIRREEAKPVQFFSLLLENPDSEATLRLSLSEGENSEDSVILRIPAGFSGWMQAGGESNIIAANYVIEVIEGDAPVRIKGLRFNKESALNWPWDEGVSLHFPGRRGIPEETACFNSVDLSSHLNRSLRIVDDTGSSVLAEVVPAALARGKPIDN